MGYGNLYFSDAVRHTNISIVIEMGILPAPVPRWCKLDEEPELEDDEGDASDEPHPQPCSQRLGRRGHEEGRDPQPDEKQQLEEPKTVWKRRQYQSNTLHTYTHRCQYQD